MRLLIHRILIILLSLLRMLPRNPLVKQLLVTPPDTTQDRFAIGRSKACCEAKSCPPKAQTWKNAVCYRYTKSLLAAPSFVGLFQLGSCHTATSSPHSPKRASR
ncbi:hypothetical protein NE237_005567 [Protea cynaroides]|uniref:Secreted protein n=1 Tax=Protea cynaroides TaxID=273540 RepID=A0A9Q0GP37_9MAGN|nr:hypothetical protein NE237_005567 [Protea cynaroides]